MKAGTRTVWTFVITSIALFMVVLDNLVVSTALPVIRVDLGASIEQLEWIVNAYTFTFAVFLLMGAALGDRFGRKRMFMVGLAVFTGASAMAALAPSTEWLIAARALQGLGGAIVTPLTLTILSGAVSAERRGAALGAWSGIAGFAVAMGPLVGGAVVSVLVDRPAMGPFSPRCCSRCSSPRSSGSSARRAPRAPESGRIPWSGSARPSSWSCPSTGSPMSWRPTRSPSTPRGSPPRPSPASVSSAAA